MIIVCAPLSCATAAVTGPAVQLGVLTRDVYICAAVLLPLAAVIALIRSRHAAAAGPLLPLTTRVRLRLHPGPGFARGRWTLHQRHGLRAARRTARTTRPSLSRRDMRRGAWPQYATFVGWAPGWIAPPRIYGTFEQLLLVIAPPRRGKSAAAAGRIIDAPGPVVATSIRGDLIDATAGLRQRVGEVHIFNPEGTGPYRSTFRWNPVAGCQDMTTAVRRAGYMVEAMTARGLDDSTFWSDQASMTLAAYLHAAGLGDGNLHDVHEWILQDSGQPLDILRQHPEAAGTAGSQVRQYLALPDRTRSGVSTTLLGTLKFMQAPEVAQIVCPPPGENLDLAAFLATRDTMYLVASDASQSPVPPLFSALIAEIAYQVRGGRAGQRLDPPLTLELDEAPNIAPVPVAAWATWAAGSGIRMHVYAQSFAQLAERWGQLGAETIWQACDVKIIYGGSSEEGLCRKVEDACGLVSVWIRGEPGGDSRPSRTRQDRPVLPFAVLRKLPHGRAVVIRGGADPVIVRTETYFRRKDVRSFTRRGGKPLLPPAVALPPAVPVPALLTAAPASIGPGARPPAVALPPSPGTWPDRSPGVLAPPQMR